MNKSSAPLANQLFRLQRLPLVALALLCLVIFSAVEPAPIGAQSGSGDWSTPINLAAKGDSLAATLKVAADVEGNVHVVWGAWVGAGAKPDQANTLFYAWWNGAIWSRPVDILVSLDPNETLQLHSLASTADGRTVVVWSSDKGLSVSQAEVGKAMDARNWTTVQVSPSRAASARLAVDRAQNRWYLAYIQQLRSVAFTSSDESGTRWESSREIWAATSNAATGFVDMAIAQDGSANIVWSENAAERNWGGVAIWRARVLLDQELTAIVKEVARSNASGPTLGWPIIVAGANKELNLFWNNGVGSSTGRFHQWSENNGATWSAIQQVFPNDLSGQTGQAGLAFDSNGVLHLITSAMGKDGRDGALRYAYWKNGVWSKYSTLGQEYFGEHPALVVTGGNRLHLVWLDRGHSAIAYSSRSVDGPSTPKQRFVARQVPTVAPPTQAGVTKIVPMPTHVAVSTTPAFSDAPPPSSATPIEMLLPGILPVIGLCVIAILIRLRSVNSRH